MNEPKYWHKINKDVEERLIGMVNNGYDIRGTRLIVDKNSELVETDFVPDFIIKDWKKTNNRFKEIVLVQMKVDRFINVKIVN